MSGAGTAHEPELGWLAAAGRARVLADIQATVELERALASLGADPQLAGTAALDRILGAAAESTTRLGGGLFERSSAKYWAAECSGISAASFCASASLSPITLVGWTAIVHASIVRARGSPLRSTMSPRAGTSGLPVPATSDRSAKTWR